MRGDFLSLKKFFADKDWNEIINEIIQTCDDRHVPKFKTKVRKDKKWSNEKYWRAREY